jgi:hypothetical protein
MPIAHAYVDGFNLYHRAVKDRPDLKWLNIAALVAEYVREGDELRRVRYYTSRVSGRTDDGQPERQDAYIRALAGIPEVTIHIGTFLSRPVCRPVLEPMPLVHPQGRQYIMVHNTEEKASDVNLASHLLMDGFKGFYDVAFVLSSDTDLIEPLRIVKTEIRKPVILLYADIERRSVPKKLEQVCTSVRFVSRGAIARNQLPNPARAKNGALVARPCKWA